MHSRWLRGSSRRPWCSVCGWLPPGRRRGWAQTQPAASPSRWWISSSFSWRSLTGDTFGYFRCYYYTPSFVEVNLIKGGQKTFNWSRLTPFKGPTLPTSALSNQLKELFCHIFTFEGGVKQGNTWPQVQGGGSLMWKRCTLWHHKKVNFIFLLTSLFYSLCPFYELIMKWCS